MFLDQSAALQLHLARLEVHMDQQQTGQKSELNSTARPGFEQEAPAAATNHDHPTKVGKRKAVPGAGIVSGGADAGPVESSPDLRDTPYPGQNNDACAPGSGPNAARPSTTFSGINSVPSHGGVNANAPGGRATEAVTSQEGGARLSAPNDATEPEGSGEVLAPELANPNYSANHRQLDKTNPTDSPTAAQRRGED
jgi:hypothetical protein